MRLVIGKNENDLRILEKIACEQNALGAKVPKSPNNGCYTWDDSGRLIGVDLAECGLRGSISFAGLDSLKELDCGYNSLTSLDVSGCPSLKWLSCGFNLLSSLDIGEKPSLMELYCGHNQLTELDVSGCTALAELDCRDNQIATLDVSGSTELEALFCKDNKLTSLNVTGCDSLKSLDCTGNLLKTLEVFFKPELRFLDYDKDRTELTYRTKSRYQADNVSGTSDRSSAGDKWSMLDGKDLKVLSIQCGQYLNEMIQLLKTRLESAAQYKGGGIFVGLHETERAIAETDFKVLLAAGEYDSIKQYYRELKEFFDTVPEEYRAITQYHVTQTQEENWTSTLGMLYRVYDACNAIWDGMLEDVADRELEDR